MSSINVGLYFNHKDGNKKNKIISAFNNFNSLEETHEQKENREKIFNEMGVAPDGVFINGRTLVYEDHEFLEDGVVINFDSNKYDDDKNIKEILLSLEKAGAECVYVELFYNQTGFVQRLKLDGSEVVDYIKNADLKRIIERVNINGNFYAHATPIPLLTLEEFFDGNDVYSSFAREYFPSDFRELFLKLLQNENIHNVYIEVRDLEDSDWPYADTAWVVTSLDVNAILSYFTGDFVPFATMDGFKKKDKIYENIVIPPGCKVYGFEWDENPNPPDL